MTRGGPEARTRSAPLGAFGVLAALAVGVVAVGWLLGGCGRVRGATAPSVPTPTSAAALGRLVVTSVPSGLPRMPDGGLRPPAGEKSLGDVAAYAGDPSRERGVLERFGYRYGWERFWGRDGGPETSVFLDQFRTVTGARQFAADLVGNDAAHYRATPLPGSGGLPAGCRLLTVEHPDASAGLRGPAAFAWCTRDVFTVAVTAVSGSPEAALREVSAVVRAQVRRLPGP